MTTGGADDAARFQRLVGAFDPQARAAFLRASEFFAPHLWVFLNREVEAAMLEGIAPALGLLALASGLIDLAEGAMEVRGALAAAGGDADVAAMILGLRRRTPLAGTAEPEAPSPPPRPRRRR